MTPVRVREGLLAAGLVVVLAAGTAGAAARQVPPRHPLDGWAWLLVGAAVAVVLVRRRWPVGALLAGAAIVAGYLAVGYPYGPVIFVVCLLSYSLARHAGTRRTVWAVGLATILLVPALVRPAPVSTLLVEAAVLLGAVLAWLGVPAWLAATVRLYRTHADDVADRALADERLRLSREVHDVVAHSLSLITLQSGAALRVWDHSPADAHAAVQAIRSTSVEALRELRQTLGELRGEVPPRGIGDVGGLVGRLDGEALRVTLTVTGPPRPLRPEADACAYRIVQESLTNVVRHAAAGSAAVTVAYEPGGVGLAVEDDGAGVADGPVPGRGLQGMGERVAELGGTLSAGPRPGGGFAVRAWIPQ
ncbi:sensor histidine kinase [Dactylosporangium sp. CA-092794]|uniref:sensor histidine kinase n=1 Tax=Dactylosporangium sp. CA-092794 TaxID=3239929 RepID=UPI003D8B966A